MVSIALMDPVLQVVEHRPWPLPRGPWIMTQTWHDLLFAHWPVTKEALRPLVPESLALDSYEGSAWLAVTPFRMSRVRARGVPALPGLSAFPELNVRTYVALDDKPGVYFFSLDAASLPAVWAARIFYRLPYYRAQMSVEAKAEGIQYASRRRRGPAPAEFRGAYRPTSTATASVKGTLEHFLTERYCLYAVEERRVYRGQIHHLPWPLQQAQADIESNTMASPLGVDLGTAPPLVHFARELKVFVWPPERVR